MQNNIPKKLAKGQLKIPPYRNRLGIFLNFFSLVNWTVVTRSSGNMRPVQWPHSEKIAFAPQRSIFYGHDRLKVMLPSARARLDADADCTHLSVWGQQRQICTDIAFGFAFGESKSCCLILDRAFECCQMAKCYTYLPWHWDNSVVIISCSYLNY